MSAMREAVAPDWDIEAVREFYRERGLDFDNLTPRHFARRTTPEQKTLDGDRFYREFAEFLANRAKS